MGHLSDMTDEELKTLILDYLAMRRVCDTISKGAFGSLSSDSILVYTKEDFIRIHDIFDCVYEVERVDGDSKGLSYLGTYYGVYMDLCGVKFRWFSANNKEDIEWAQHLQ